MLDRLPKLELRLAISVCALYFVDVLVVGVDIAAAGNNLGNWGSWLAGNFDTRPNPIRILFISYG